MLPFQTVFKTVICSMLHNHVSVEGVVPVSLLAPFNCGDWIFSSRYLPFYILKDQHLSLLNDSKCKAVGSERDHHLSLKTVDVTVCIPDINFNIKTLGG